MSEAIIVRRAPAPIGAPYRDCLVPAGKIAADAIGKLPLGEGIAIVVKRDRSLPQHRLFFAVLQFVSQASKWETPERLLAALKIRLGRYDLMQLPNGKVVPVPQSISFAAMGQDAFQDFMDQAVAIICSEVLPGTDSAQLIAEVQAMMSPDTLAQERKVA